MEGRLVSALREVLEFQGVSEDDYDDIMQHISSTPPSDLFCVAAAAGVVEDAFRAAYDAAGAPELRCIQKRACFAIYLIDAVVCASATGREPALRALLQACRGRGETLSIPTCEGLGIDIGCRWDRACIDLCDWIAQGPLGAISLEYLDVLDLNSRWVSGGLSMMHKLSLRPSSPTLIAVMRTFPPEAWEPVDARGLPSTPGPLCMMYASSEELFVNMLPHIPDAAFAQCSPKHPHFICSRASEKVAMSTFSAAWERSKEHLGAADAARLCGVLLTARKASLHPQLDLVLSSLSDEVRMEVLRRRPNGSSALYAGILARVTHRTSPAAVAVVLKHILDAPRELVLMSQETLTNFFGAMYGTDQHRNTEDVLRLLIEACVDQSARGTTSAVALVCIWYIGDRHMVDNMQLFMRYVSPGFLDYMLERVPLSDEIGDERHCSWLHTAASEELYDEARVLERHVPRREEVRRHMEAHFPDDVAHIYPTLAKRAVCA